eukprot:gene4672-8244_t
MKSLIVGLLFCFCLINAVPQTCIDGGVLSIEGEEYAQPGSSTPATECDEKYSCLLTCPECPKVSIPFLVKTSSTWMGKAPLKWAMCKAQQSPCTCEKFYVNYLGYSVAQVQSILGSICQKHCGNRGPSVPSNSGIKFGIHSKVSHSFSRTSRRTLEEKAQELENEATSLEEEAAELEGY